MTTKTILEHTNLGTAPASADKFAVVDVSDTTDAASGTTKKVTAANVLDQYLANITSENLTDFSDVAITAPSSGEALIYNSGSGDFENAAFSVGVGERDFVASGAIAQGDICIVNADGTATDVQLISPVTGTSTAPPDNNTTQHRLAFDESTGIGVLVYKDKDTTDYGTGVAFNINASTNTLTFGTPVVFESATINPMGISHDPASGNFVIAYKNATGLSVIAASVSGLVISYGTAVAGETGSHSVVEPNCLTYDSSAGVHVYAFRDQGNSFYGTANYASLSGTTVTLGTSSVFNSFNSTFNGIAYSSVADKTVIGFSDAEFTGYGHAIVATYGSPSMTYGSKVQVVAASWSLGGNDATYDSGNDKILMSYRNQTDTYGYSIVGTISGTSISFGTPNAFLSANCYNVNCTYFAPGGVVAIVYDDRTATDKETVVATISGTSVSHGSPTSLETSATPDSQSIVSDSISKRLVSVSYHGTVSRYQVWLPVSVTNATSENVAGVATAAISDTATGTIKVSGGTSAEFAGLTIGSEYFVSDAGAATTTDTGRPLGRAISGTEILLRTV